MKLLTSLLILMILLSIGTAYADVDCEVVSKSDTGTTTVLHINGTIKSTDVIAARKCIEKTSHSLPLRIYDVHLNSIGGDIYAAMELGRLLRKNRFNVWAKQCMSSCVLVLAGSVERFISDVEIGIHRPYSLKTGVLDFEDAQSQYQKARSDIQNYLNEMNIPSSLFDAMERIPPHKIKILTQQEIDQFGLSGLDPVEREVRDADHADRRGISKQEFLRRIAEAPQKCRNSSDEWACKQAYSWGLTTSVYLKRFGQFDICEEVKKEFGFDSNESRKCIREVMLGVRQ